MIRLIKCHIFTFNEDGRIFQEKSRKYRSISCTMIFAHNMDNVRDDLCLREI